MKRNLIVPGMAFPYLLVCLIAVWSVGLLAQLPSSVSASSPMRQQHTYTGPAGSRPYFVYTPENYRVGTAVPLIVMLHGCTQTAVDFAAGTQMNQLADQYNFIVVYPQQTSAYNQNLCWNWFLPSNQARDRGEPAIIVGIVRTIEQKTSLWTIDPNRIYVAGISAGASMAVILGATYPDVFAAIGLHSGVEYQAATSAMKGLKVMRQGGPDPVQQGHAAYAAMGTVARAIPAIVFQGTGDAIVSPVNGDQVVQQWMQTDYLASSDTYNANFTRPTSAKIGQPPSGRSYTIFKWNDSNGSELQEYWRVDGMGHAWSGGNPTGSYTDPLGPNASLAMYQFFMNHPMHEALARWHPRSIGSRVLKGLRGLGSTLYETPL
jgi:poly(hydroxyalkanoate) depolymerase family esterase